MSTIQWFRTREILVLVGPRRLWSKCYTLGGFRYFRAVQFLGEL
jgi:hypothetical protein